MACSISQRSQTRPQGLNGAQKMARWMLSSRSLRSMSSKSMRQTPSSSRTSGLCTMVRPVLLIVPVNPM